MAGIDDTYIVHCAQTTCDMGMRASRIVLTKSHGVFLKGMAQMHVKDCKGTENVICFGGCMSPENPKTVEAAKEVAREVAAETQMDFEEYVTDMFTQETEEGKKVMACFGECTPEIVSIEWDKEKEDVYVEPGKKALLGAATLTCKYGGIIEIVTTGQPEE
ncbi:MAG: DUF4280 domain-containing protein [Lachnospiraceae bacterium]|nr:DUF4280 domain-containing protein [Lachnospiraceae bacterium]MDE6185073.1 DUF4280 domain-containing protein [Lachnospiraceae bacterium]